MSDIKISEMPEATELNNNDLLMVVQNGVNKKVKIEKLCTYSTEETKTGETWIDGKPIYRKVYVITNPTVSTWTKIPHGISNLGIIFLEMGYFSDNSNNYTTMPENNNQGNCKETIEGENISYLIQGHTNVKELVLCYKYTKTTD